MVCAVKGSCPRQSRIECLVNGVAISCTIDTGSPISLISKELANDLNLGISRQHDFHNLQGVSGTRLSVVGVSRDVPIKINEQTFETDLVVVSNVNKATILLGLHSISSSGLILYFASGKVSTNVESSSNRLVSKIEADGNYKIKPLSTTIIFAKVDLVQPTETTSEFSCTDLILKRQDTLKMIR